MEGVKWVQPGRALLRPNLATRDVAQVVREATTVQFDQPLPAPLMEALASAMSQRPEVALYLYGYSGWGDLDGSLSFLQGFEHVRQLGLALFELRGVQGLSRFERLQKLSLRHGSALDLAVLASLPELSELVLDVPRFKPDVLGHLLQLRRLTMSGRRGFLAPLTGHPTLERLELTFGTERDLSPLTSCQWLRDLRLWQITRLTSHDLAAVGQITRLDALMLGALRHVESLEPLVAGNPPVRFLELEQLRGLGTLQPLASLHDLRACTIFDSRPADRSLAPLASPPKLEEVFIGGSGPFPKQEVDALAAAFAARKFRYRDRDIGPTEVPRLGWRGLFGYADRVRAAESHGASLGLSTNGS